MKWLELQPQEPGGQRADRLFSCSVGRTPPPTGRTWNARLLVPSLISFFLSTI